MVFIQYSKSRENTQTSQNHTLKIAVNSKDRNGKKRQRKNEFLRH